MDLPVVPHDPDAGDATHSGLADGTYSEREYYTLRNQLLAVLRPFGTVGPMGDSPLSAGTDLLNGVLECTDPDFHVPEDRWNDEQVVVHVETSPELLTAAVFAGTVRLLGSWPGWAVSYTLFRNESSLGGVLLFHDRVMVAGAAFVSCATLSQVAQACEAFVA